MFVGVGYVVEEVLWGIWCWRWVWGRCGGEVIVRVEDVCGGGIWDVCYWRRGMRYFS